MPDHVSMEMRFRGSSQIDRGEKEGQANCPQRGKAGVG